MRWRRDRSGRRLADRAQLVLAAAGVIAIALVPMLIAYLQLGYHADVAAGADAERPGENVERALERAARDAATDADGDYAWSQRRLAVASVNRSLAEPIATLEASRVEEGVAYDIRRNGSAAERWAAADCPRGPNRRFGDCEARGGVVVQERAGETTALAVAFDVTRTDPVGETSLTLTIAVRD